MADLLSRALVCLTLTAAACAAGTDEGMSDGAADPAPEGIGDVRPDDDPAPIDGLDGIDPAGDIPSDPAAEEIEDTPWDWPVDEATDATGDILDAPDLTVDPDMITDVFDEETWTDTFDPVPDMFDAPDAADTVVDEIVEESPPGEVWMEISYQYRSVSESPTTADWSYSTTPAWTEAQWAPSSSSWPYIHVPDGGSLVSDPIGGTVLELGCYDRFRLFFGLEELSHVGYATVTLEGRSRATSAGVDIEIWNPGAGSSIVSYASMSQDWTADIVTVDFTAEAGNGFQAVEIAPIARSCSLALRRVRLTLYSIY
jgi:hypothetical protein